MIPKLKAHYFENKKWYRVNRWFLINLALESEIAYHLFCDKKKFYLRAAVDSPLVYFDRFNGIFSLIYGDTTTMVDAQCSIYHCIIQEVIYDKSVTKLKMWDRRHKGWKEIIRVIQFERFEPEKNILINGNNYCVDLIGYFSEPADLAIQWKGQIHFALCQPDKTRSQKIIDYGVEKLPLIEVLTKSYILKEENKPFATITEDEENEIRDNFRVSFDNHIRVELLVNAVSDEYLESKAVGNMNIRLNDLAEQNRALIHENEIEHKKITELNSICRKSLQLLRTLEKENDELKLKNQNMSDLIEEWGLFKA